MPIFAIAILAVASTIVYVAPAPSYKPGPGRPTVRAYGITSDASIVAGRSFHYIICGGGLIGLTVASRLTENPRISVFVIEARQDHHHDPRVYDMRTYGQAFQTELDWNITSKPVPWQNDTGLELVAGRMLGGSGCLNGARWTKGPSSRYDLLPLLTGDDSWAWEPFNKYMLGAEHFNLPEQQEIARGAKYDPAFHGENGPVQVSFAAGIFAAPQQEALEASQKVWKGLTRDEDAATGTVTGATIIPNMVETVGPEVLFLDPGMLISNAGRVAEPLFSLYSIDWNDCDRVIAEGVYFQACPDCEKHFVKTKREVLLAAGSLQSPQILELSGVGDPDVLAAAGVPVKKASPGVGKHMQEQTKNSLYLTSQSLEYKGSGPPSAIAFPDVHMLLKDNASATYDCVMSTLPSHAAELEKQGLVVSAKAAQTILEAQVNNIFKDNAPAAEIFFTITPSTGQLGIDLWNLIVLSRGTCHIRSNSSWDHPVVEPSYFGHPLDLMFQIAASKQSREVYNMEPLAQYVLSEDEPGGAVGPENDDGDWEDWVRQSFTSVWHYIATLAMMKEEYGGVVGGDFKVYGVENVRAIDESVLPIQLSAHLSSSLYGIAEKAAVAIQKDQRA